LGANTLESLKSSVRGGISSRNANISPHKTTNDERVAKLRQNRPFYINTRANSETLKMLSIKNNKAMKNSREIR